MALSSTDTIMTMLKMPSAVSEKTRIDVIRVGVERAVKSYCHWDMEMVVDAVEYKSGGGQAVLPLNNMFVAGVSHVYLDQLGAAGQNPLGFQASSELPNNGSDWMLNKEGYRGKSGLLERLTASNPYMFPSDLVFYRSSGGLSFRKPAFWPAGQGNLKIVYTYGFAVDLDVTGATWASNTITFVCASAHNLIPGDNVTVSGVTPNGYNGTYKVRTVPSSTTFTVKQPSTLGPLTVAGTLYGVPEDIVLAIATAVGLVRNTVRYGWPTQSESLVDYNYSLAIQQLPMFGDVRQLLAPYRDLSV